MSREKQPSYEYVISNEVKQRFDALLIDVPVRTDVEHWTFNNSRYLPILGIRLNTKPSLRRHDVQKQILSQIVTDPRYLTGPYRTPNWGNLVVEHIYTDTVTDIRDGSITEVKPERYTLTFIDHSTHAYTGNQNDRGEVYFQYQFDPNSLVDPIHATVGPAINFGDGNYPYFEKALETAELLLDQHES